ncbi:hypothetical protein ACJX0J_002136 [Zea mays]
MKVEVYILIHYDNEKYFYISDQNDQEYPNLINHLLIGLDESFKLTRTIWFSEKTPGTLHQNKIVYEETTRKIHILIHKSYIGNRNSLLFSFFKRKMDFIEVINYSNSNNSGERIAINAKREHLESGIQGIVNFENLQMHKYIPEREVGEKKHFSVYQMMIHSAIWSEQGFMFSLYQYTKLILLRHAIFSIHYL